MPPFQNERKFKHYVLNPIASNHELAFERLRKLIEATCLRRTKAICLSNLGLPPKHEERPVELELDEASQTLYQFFTRRATTLARIATKALKNGAPTDSNENFLTLIGILRLICDHGGDLLPEAALNAWKRKNAASVDWNMPSDSQASALLAKSILKKLAVLEMTQRN